MAGENAGNTSRWASYKDVFDVLDRAVESERGIKLRLKDGSARIAFRHRIYKARLLDREQSKKAFSPEDESYDTSVYDGLVVKIMGDNEMTISQGGAAIEIAEIEEL